MMEKAEDRETRVRQTRWTATAQDLGQVASILAEHMGQVSLVDNLRVCRAEWAWVPEQNLWTINLLAEGSSQVDRMPVLAEVKELATVKEDV